MLSLLPYNPLTGEEGEEKATVVIMDKENIRTFFKARFRLSDKLLETNINSKLSGSGIDI